MAPVADTTALEQTKSRYVLKPGYGDKMMISMRQFDLRSIIDSKS
jgi:hypothetical protein